MKKIISFSIILALMMLSILFSAPTVLAVNLNINTEAIENDIFPSEFGEFGLTIENKENKDLKFSIEPFDVEWNMMTNPAKHASVFEVKANSQASTEIFLSPLNKYIQPGLHNVYFILREHETGDITRISVFINIKPQGSISGEYLPSFRGSVKIESEIDPREDAKISVYTENMNPRNIEKLKIILTSDSINEQREISLSPKGESGDKKSVVFDISLDDFHSPSKEKIKAVLMTEFDGKNFTFETEAINLEIIKYGGIEDQKDSSWFLFKTTETRTYSNTGNSIEETEVLINYPFILRGVISTEPKGEKIKKDGTTYLSVNLMLDKQDTQIVIVKKDYRGLVSLILISLVGIVFYYRFRSPLVLTKDSKVIGKLEGGVSEIKMILHIKNRSKTDVEEIEISDKASPLVEISQTFEVGVLHPTKVLKSKAKGTIIKWELNQLDVGDERIMTYTVTAKMSLLGKISIPIAVVEYKSPKSGKKRFYKSKKLSVWS